MVSWAAGDQKDIFLYSPATGQPEFGGNQLASAGTVDANLQSRVQYDVIRGGSYFVLQSAVGLTFSSADVTFAAGRKMGATMFLARASQFADGVVPTPSQILALGSSLIAVRGDDYYTSAGPGNVYNFGIYDMDRLAPNTKYWLLIIPTAFYLGAGASTANDKPLTGSVNTIGRAVSVWTNRTPTAPVITSPVAGTEVSPGSTFNLTFTPNDPDKVVGGTAPKYTDLAGVQVQYADLPSVDNPTPAWTDLPIGNNGGSALGPGWAIQGSTALPSDSGSFLLLANQTIVVRAGSNLIYPNQASLPAGPKQLRVRTFDFGHDYPLVNRPLGNTRAASTLTPSLYPAVNVSPWSDPVNVTITTQVPAPIPLSPVGDIAIAQGTDVTLAWKYRSTATPANPQATRTVQIRKVGDIAWVTLTSGAGSAPNYPVAASFFAVGEYEWRVQVTDSTTFASNYSSIARFWIVPAPDSSNTRPVPSDTTDGATLGSGTYRVFVYRRGGIRRVGEIRGISHLDWNRVRDAISVSKIVVSDWDIDLGNLLSQLQPWAYEMVIFRNNAFSVDRVWEGPISLLTYERESVTIDAKDVMNYAYRRIIKQAMNDSGAVHGTTVVNRAMRVLQNVMAKDDPNVLANLTPLTQADDSMQYRSIPAYSRTAFEEIDDMAANAGLDYTCAGRSILLWGTRHRIGTLPELRDEDLGSAPIVSVYGMSMANVYAVSDGNGVWGEADRLDVSGNDPIYGLVEMLSSSWASDADSETGTYTEQGLETIRKSFEGYAERSISDRYSPGPPVVVRVPDNTTLNPSAVISIQQLIPGVVIPLRSNGTLRRVEADQKLDSMKVVVENGEEKISITLSPFSDDDSAAGEAEEV